MGLLLAPVDANGQCRSKEAKSGGGGAVGLDPDTCFEGPQLLVLTLAGGYNMRVSRNKLHSLEAEGQPLLQYLICQIYSRMPEGGHSLLLFH